MQLKQNASKNKKVDIRKKTHFIFTEYSKMFTQKNRNFRELIFVAANDEREERRLNDLLE